MSENGVMMQFFHWYTSDDGRHWQQAAAKARELAETGFTAIWLPPAGKGLGGASDVGYGVYDLYDLGEFDQMGTVRTKYGTRAGYLEAIGSLQRSGMQVYADTVLNHRIGGDGSETVMATPFRQMDRVNPVAEPRKISCYSRFSFPGRNGTYSDFQWNSSHFDAVDYDGLTGEQGMIYLLDGKTFDDQVALENGNFAYLMGCDLDFQNPEVRNELTTWGKWFLDTTGCNGLRLDALKHISAWFFPAWLDELERHCGRDLFVTGEYWSPDVKTLHWYLDAMGHRMSVFDVPLHYNFQRAGIAGGSYDMRTILDSSLMKERPLQAVTFVDNHDSQPLQALESVVEPWFKPLAYALILLRAEGYPCVFMADYDGAEYEDKGRDGKNHRIVMPSHRHLIDIFMKARQKYCFGEQHDYFDHHSTIGWTRLGNGQHPKAMAVVMSNGLEGWKWMSTGRPHASFTDCTGHRPWPVITNEHGWGVFHCNGGSVSVWLED